ncbi:MAG: 50S ribosomal protein L18e [Candidatus Woesearchaeota archaeon]
MKRTGPSNPELQKLIIDLRRISHKENSDIWTRIASDLQKSTRSRRVVNLSRINRYSSDNDTVIVPGKVLSSGSLSHKVHVAAFSFSAAARESILSSKGSALSIQELIKQNPKGKNVRIIG